jgi:hypothetical protein
MTLEASVYGLYFPKLCAIKVGFTSFRNGKSGLCRTTYIRSGRQNGRRMFGQDGDIAEGIWLQPGDFRYESYIQTCLSFRYTQPEWPRGGGGGRLYEWFYTANKSCDALVSELDELYVEVKALDVQWAA